jgi:hypothetical protein
VATRRRRRWRRHLHRIRRWCRPRHRHHRR